MKVIQPTFFEMEYFEGKETSTCTAKSSHICKYATYVLKGWELQAEENI
jgi:hypothetical protein